MKLCLFAVTQEPLAQLMDMQGMCGILSQSLDRPGDTSQFCPAKHCSSQALMPNQTTLSSSPMLTSCECA